MEKLQQNKELIIRYFNAISGVIKTPEISKNYVADEELLAHIAFFDAAFPEYEISADQMTAEDNRVIVRARFKGCHKGDFAGMAPTHRTVDFPFVISYEIENGKIVHHWLIADQMSLMDQLTAAAVSA
jgi:predicted ester cyclase